MLQNMDTVEALKNTSKGKLRYCKPWEEHSPSEKKLFLNELSGSPPITVEAATHRTKSLNTTFTASLPSPGSPTLIPPFILPTTPQTFFMNESNLVLSPIDEIREDLNNYLADNEDYILREVEANMTRWRIHFTDHKERTRVPVRRRTNIREEAEQIQAEEEQEEEKALKKLIEEKLKSSENSYLSHYQYLKSEIQRNEKRRQQQMKELQEARRVRIEALKSQFMYWEEQVMAVTQNIFAVLKSCQHSAFLDNEVLSANIEVFNTLFATVTNLITTEKNSDSPSEDMLHTVESMVAQCNQVLARLKEEVEKADVKGEEMLKREAELERQKKEKEEQQKKLQQPIRVDLNTGQTNQGATQGERKGKSKGGVSLGVIVSSNALQSYSDYQEKIEDAMKKSDTLSKSTDPKVKKYRFELQKAVNTPVCGISDQSGEHLVDKIRRLKQLLSGESVSVVGGTVSTRDHPEAKTYCLNFLAKKLVKQGEEQVSSRPVTAFPIAGVIVHLSCDFPELLQLFVAHCLSSCPVLVPIYFEKNQATNELEWHRLQGYKVSDEGVIEKEDLYLKRIGGVIKLYAAVMQTSVASTLNKPQQYGLEHCWVWLARVLNVVPRENITATAIYIVLEVCGNAMLKKYGRQFQKLLQLLYKEYLPKIANVTPADHQGPYSRLKMFLDDEIAMEFIIPSDEVVRLINAIATESEDSLSKGHIPDPEGLLSENFWRTQTKSNIVGF